MAMCDWRLWVAVPVLAAATYVLAQSGIDAVVNDLARTQNPTLSLVWSAFPMLAGMAVPILVPMGLALRGERSLAATTLAAFLAAFAVVSLLKGVTSRVHPEAIEPATALARSQVFRFGFMESGWLSLVEGWPSGHAATNGAVGFVLARLTTLRWLAVCAIVWVVWVALATVFGISGDVHWLSDSLAGLAIAALVSAGVLRNAPKAS